MDSDIFLRDITHARFCDDEDPRRRPRKEEGLSSLEVDHANDDADSLVRFTALGDARVSRRRGRVFGKRKKEHWRECRDEKQRCLDNGWDVDDEEVLQRWRDQEPINAHSHFAAMLLGSSETVPVTRGKLVLGQWQSVMMVDTDGPRERKVGIQAIGFK